MSSKLQALSPTLPYSELSLVRSLNSLRVSALGHLSIQHHLCAQGEPTSAAGRAEHARAGDHESEERKRQEGETVQRQIQAQKLEGRALHEHQALEEVCTGHIHTLNVYGFS